MAESADQSHLDLKYLIDEKIYNCPFCNRRHVSYKLDDVSTFNWTSTKTCWIYVVKCNSCSKKSMHLAFSDVYHRLNGSPYFTSGTDLDSVMFYSVPTSFFVLDDRIPAVIRELITEAESSRKMNLLTGASACARKAVYEFLVKEEAEGEHYQDKIKSLKARFSNIDPDLFDILGHIQDMTSDKVHEQSWPKWDSANLTLIIETLKAVLHEVYVVPQEKAGRSGRIRSCFSRCAERRTFQTIRHRLTRSNSEVFLAP